MEKKIKEQFSKEILSEAISVYPFEIESCKEIRSNNNFIFELLDNKNAYILRITQTFFATCLLLNLIGLFGFSSEAADSTKSNGAYFELIGTGGVYSVNYTREIKSSDIRLGFSYIPWHSAIGDYIERYWLFPLEISWQKHLPNQKNAFEYGFGLTTIILEDAPAEGYAIDDRQVFFFPTGNLSYVRMLTDNVYAKVSFYPLLVIGVEPGCPVFPFPWCGFGVGVKF